MARDVQGGDIYQKRSKVLSPDPLAWKGVHRTPNQVHAPFQPSQTVLCVVLWRKKKLSAPLIGMQSK